MLRPGRAPPSGGLLQGGQAIGDPLLYLSVLRAAQPGGGEWGCRYDLQRLGGRPGPAPLLRTAAQPGVTGEGAGGLGRQRETS